MKDAFERFFNWQSDADWTWGPLLSWRPAPSVRLDKRFCWKVLGFTALAVPILLFLLRTAPALPGLLAGTFHLSWAAVFAVIRDNVFLLFLPVMGLMILMSVPYLWAWNRRADRLSQLPPEQPDASPADANEGVWPPPPTAPLPAQKRQ